MSDELFTIPRVAGSKIDLDLRERILGAFLAGKSQKEIATEFGISTGAIRGIIKSEDRMARVRENKEDYDVKARMRMINKAFVQLESMIERCTDEFRMKAIVDSVNILIHTRRIEEGLTGANVADKPFTMNVIIDGNVRDLASQDDVPELTAGDQIIDVNPVEVIETTASVEDDFT